MYEDQFLCKISDCDGLCLSTNVDLEGFGVSLDDPEGTFIGALQGGAVGVTTDKHKLRSLKIGWNRDRCSSMSRGENGG